MPQAITHFLIPVILLELFRNSLFDKKVFPVHYVFITGLAGLLPDLDIAVYYVMSFFGFTIQEVHRTFSHTLLIPLFFVILSLLFSGFKNKEIGKSRLRMKYIFLVIAFGIFTHLALDALISGDIMPFFPLSTLKIGLNLISLVPLPWQNTILPTLDAMILVFWMIYLEVKHKISRFI
jgi:membrane-bound metal-dependent hydrolase YbcI (DUF457 family)